MKTRVTLSAGIIFIVMALMVFLSASVWAAEKYPSKPINLVVGYAAGGMTDSAVRVVSEAAKVHLGVPIVILNKPGAGTGIAMETVKNTRPDGYNLGANGTSTFAIVRMGQANFDFLNDFVPICKINDWFTGFSVNASSPWKTFEEFRNYAKANPGKIKYGISGPGNTAHLLAEDLAYQAGIKMVSIPHPSDPATAAALMGDHIQAATTAYTGFGEYAKAGKTRVLVVFKNERMTEFPNVPTAKELGYNITKSGFVGIVGPKGLPADVAKTIAEAYRKALQDPKVIKSLDELQLPASYLGPEDYSRSCREYDEWMVNIMKKIGMIK